MPALFYVPLALAAIAVGSTIAAVASGDFWVLGYVIYGLIAIFLVIIPSVLAYWFARKVPWPTLLATITNLERRWCPAAAVVLARAGDLADPPGPSPLARPAWLSPSIAAPVRRSVTWPAIG